MPLTRDHSPVEPCTSERDRALNGVFTTALEGGVGYWSTCSRYHWSIGDEAHTEARDFIAVITEVGDGDVEVEHVIDRSVISLGIAAFYTHMRTLSQAGSANTYQWQAAKDLHWGKWDEVDYDSDTADMIVQLGLLGELRYG